MILKFFGTDAIKAVFFEAEALMLQFRNDPDSFNRACSRLDGTAVIVTKRS